MRFADVLVIRNGRNQRQVECPNGKYPIYGSGGVMGHANSYICEANTVVIGRKGNINSPIFVEEPFWNVDTAFGLIPHADVLIPKYLFYFCENYNFEKLNTTVTIPSLTKANLLQVEIDVPEIGIQKSRVGILDKIEHSCRLLQQEASRLDQLVKSRFVEMFGDPENNPKHWDKTSLSNVISNANNGMARRGNDAEGSIVLRLVELQDGFIDYSSPNRIVLSETEKKRYLLKNRDFLFARVNGNPENVGRCAEFSDIGEPVYHNDHIIRVHFDENLINGCFASALLNSAYGKRQMAGQIKTSAGQYTINQEGIGAIVTVLPPIELQNRFAAFVAEVDKSKLAVKQSLEKLETLKKSLMQQYFGG